MIHPSPASVAVTGTALKLVAVPDAPVFDSWSHSMSTAFQPWGAKNWPLFDAWRACEPGAKPALPAAVRCDPVRPICRYDHGPAWGTAGQG